MTRDMYCGLTTAKGPALTIIDQIDGSPKANYAVRHLHRWPVVTSHETIVDDMARIIGSDQMVDSNVDLIVDATGDGKSLVDMLRAENLRANVAGFVIDNGPRRHDDFVTEKEIFSLMSRVVSDRRIKIGDLPFGKDLVLDLAAVRVKVTPERTEEFSNAGSLLISLMLAVWYVETFKSEPPGG